MRRYSMWVCKKRRYISGERVATWKHCSVHSHTSKMRYVVVCVLFVVIVHGEPQGVPNVNFPGPRRASPSRENNHRKRQSTPQSPLVLDDGPFSQEPGPSFNQRFRPSEQGARPPPFRPSGNFGRPQSDGRPENRPFGPALDAFRPPSEGSRTPPALPGRNPYLPHSDREEVRPPPNFDRAPPFGNPYLPDDDDKNEVAPPLSSLKFRPPVDAFQPPPDFSRPRPPPPPPPRPTTTTTTTTEPPPSPPRIRKPLPPRRPEREPEPPRRPEREPEPPRFVPLRPGIQDPVERPSVNFERRPDPFPDYDQYEYDDLPEFRAPPPPPPPPPPRQKKPIRKRPLKPIRRPSYGYQEDSPGSIYDYDSDVGEEQLEEEDGPDRLTLLLQQSTFDCVSKKDGYYADEGVNCEVFHYCQDSVMSSWICPEGAAFHQVHLICMPVSDQNVCKKSSSFHFVNDYLYQPLGEDGEYADRYYPKGYEPGSGLNLEEMDPNDRPDYRPHDKSTGSTNPGNLENYYPRNRRPSSSSSGGSRSPVRAPQYETDERRPPARLPVYESEERRPPVRLPQFDSPPPSSSQVFRSPEDVSLPFANRRRHQRPQHDDSRFADFVDVEDLKPSRSES